MAAEPFDYRPHPRLTDRQPPVLALELLAFRRVARYTLLCLGVVLAAVMGLFFQKDYEFAMVGLAVAVYLIALTIVQGFHAVLNSLTRLGNTNYDDAGAVLHEGLQIQRHLQHQDRAKGD